MTNPIRQLVKNHHPTTPPPHHLPYSVYSDVCDGCSGMLSLDLADLAAKRILNNYVVYDKIFSAKTTKGH